MKFITKITFKENDGIDRVNEPVQFGIPFPAGLVRDVKRLQFRRNEITENSQISVTQVWADGSVQWAMVLLFVTVPATTTVEFQLFETENNSPDVPYLNENDNEYIADLSDDSKISFQKSGMFTPFSKLQTSHNKQDFDWDIYLKNVHGSKLNPVITNSCIENSGLLCSIICYRGNFSPHNDLQFTCRLYIYHNIRMVRCDFRLHNTAPASHKGNYWDLGDPGSINFLELTLSSKLPGVDWQTVSIQPQQTAVPIKFPLDQPVDVLQQSSGGENWNSSNHINASRKNFRKVKTGILKNGTTSVEIDRIQPVFSLKTDTLSLTFTIKEFWQNFPKGVSVGKNGIDISLFPLQNDEVYELQGGEAKVHSMFFAFDNSQSLNWCSTPLVPIYAPSWIETCDVYRFFTCESSSDSVTYFNYIKNIIDGDHNFFKNREKIDEFGWRNFGECYADHESRYNEPDAPFVSHYNNQYDVLYWSQIHFFRSGDIRWFRLADAQARHTRDIDVYDTEKDRFEYNGGLFWHTNHYYDAGTCSHRCYSVHHLKNGVPAASGGPSAQNCYISGLVLYYYLTGDRFVFDACKKVSRNILLLVNGPGNLVATFKYRLKRFIQKVKNSIDKSMPPYGLFEGPGREAANALTTLCTGYELTRDKTFLRSAERLIKICVSPNEKISKRVLLNAETRWSYTMFLQSITTYLLVKNNYDIQDHNYRYAKNVLNHYAKWMLKNEQTYLSRSSQLEFPNETWAAQDIRKSMVFFACAYFTDSKELRFELLKKAEEFFQNGFKDLSSFGIHQFLTRPLVIALGNGLQREYIKKRFS